MITENLAAVNKRIDEACMRAGRDRKDVTLIAVSKTKPLSDLMEAYAAGCRDFGENWVQELTEKIPEMPADVRWHMIGHLQRNKVKYIVGKVFMIHSVDSLRLAEEISKESVKKGVISNVLIEINVAGEASKFGTTLNDAKELVKAAAALPGISVHGLMTIAPNVEKPEDNREVFKALSAAAQEIRKDTGLALEYISMGMTGDFEVAVEEGANYVRVGTGIFGARVYKTAEEQGTTEQK